MKKLFMILPLVFVLCFVYGCQDKTAMVELEEFKAQAEVEEQKKADLMKMAETSLEEQVLAPLVLEEQIHISFLRNLMIH